MNLSRKSWLFRICLILLVLTSSVLVRQTAFGFHHVQQLDQKLLESLSYNRSAELDLFVESVSLVSPFIEYGTAVEFGISGYLNDDEGACDTGIVSLSSLMATQAVCLIFKYTINRERPNLNNGYQPRLLNTRLTPSFPSGHTASSFAFATVFSSEYPELRVLLFGYAALSGFSQVYVGNHYPLDVLAGAILGYSISAVVVNHRDKLLNFTGLETQQKEAQCKVKITFFRANW